MHFFSSRLASTKFEDQLTQRIGTLIYMAPEIMLGGMYNEKADIYSYGMMMTMMIMIM